MNKETKGWLHCFKWWLGCANIPTENPGTCGGVSESKELKVLKSIDRRLERIESKLTK